ncbi:MAG: thiol-disulfide oxidoreductase [Chitinophagaceae bacterium]
MQTSKPIVLFDGVCNYCNRMVNFIIRQDRKKVFLFAPLQSNTGRQILEKFSITQQAVDSFIIYEKGKVYLRSTAALKLYNRLPWYWKWTQLFWIVPRFLRDAVYDVFAKNRYKWFGKKEECMVPATEIKDRFV